MIRSKGEKVFNFFNVLVMILLLLAFALPYLLIVTTSLTAEAQLMKVGPSLFIKDFSFEAYKFIFTVSDTFIRSLGVSVYITVVTALLSVVVNVLIAYPLSKSQLVGRKWISMFVVFTMLFGGGTIPFYLLVDKLGMLNSLWSLILPILTSAWNIILLRNYFAAIPSSVEEAAKMDGAGNMMILFRIYIPLSMSVIATVTLFSAVNQWNSWITTLMFIDTNHSNLYPIQFLIRQLLNSLDSLSDAIGGGTSANIPQQSVQNAAIVVATLPIILVYPFLQRYFINGVMIGSVKE